MCSFEFKTSLTYCFDAMGIIYQTVRRTRKKPDAKQRQLADDWEALKAKHSAPLERGHVNRGTTVPKLTNKQKRELRRQQQALVVEPLPHSTSFGSATLPVVDPLAGAKRELSARVGQSFSKGGLQYLTDDELAEQRTGVHKRR